MEQGLKALMLILETLEIQVIINNHFKESSFDSYACEFRLSKIMFKFLQLSLLKLRCAIIEERLNGGAGFGLQIFVKNKCLKGNLVVFVLVR